MNKLRTMFASAPVAAGSDTIGIGLARIGQAAQAITTPDNKAAKANLAEAVRDVIATWHEAGVDPNEAGQRAAAVFNGKGSGTACRYALAAAAGVLALQAGTLELSALPSTSIANVEAAGIAAQDEGYADARKLASDSAQLLAKLAADAAGRDTLATLAGMIAAEAKRLGHVVKRRAAKGRAPESERVGNDGDALHRPPLRDATQAA